MRRESKDGKGGGSRRRVGVEEGGTYILVIMDESGEVEDSIKDGDPKVSLMVVLGHLYGCAVST